MSCELGSRALGDCAPTVVVGLGHHLSGKGVQP
jgi:hypothetical protein